MDAMRLERRGVQRGLLCRTSGGGCLSPRVLDFLCFDTQRSVLDGAEGEELPFFLAYTQQLEALVQQVRDALETPRLPLPVLHV